MTAYLLECLPYDSTAGAKKLVVFASGLVDESYLGRSIPYPLRLKNTFSMETSVFENNVPSSTSFSLGSLDINNADGRFDDLLDLGWGGASVVLLAGPENGSYFDFRPVFTGAALDISANANDLTLVLRDTSWLFAEKLQRNIYSGGGGQEGFSDLSGQFKPLCYGLAKNVSPVAVDNVNLCFQVHDGTIVGITGVFDDAVKLTFFNNYPDYASLLEAKIPTGSYATCLAIGFFRLGAPPVGVLTADVRGEFYGATSLSGVLYSILMYKVGLPAAVLDVPTFSEHAVEFPYPPSGIYYQNPEVQIDEFLGALMGMCDSFWNITTASKLAIRRFKFRHPVAGLREENIKDLQRQTNSKPVYTVTVNYDRNLTVQDSGSMPISDGDLLAALNQDVIWYPNGPVSGVLNAYIGNTKVNDLKIVTFSKQSNVGWATIDNVGKFILTDAPDGGRVNFRVEYMAQKVDVELLVRRRSDGTGFFLETDPDIFQFRKDGTPLVADSRVVIRSGTNTGLRTNAWEVTDNFGKPISFYADNADQIVVETAAVGAGTSSYIIATQFYNGDPVNKIHIPISRTDASVGSLGEGGTYNDGTPIDDLKPQEAGSNVTEQRVSEAVRGQSEWATQNTLPVSTVSTKIGKIQPDGTIKLGYEGILLSEKGDYWISDSTVVTTLGIASGIAKQGALAIQNSADWQTQVQGPGRPENYATSGVNLIYNGTAENIKPEEALSLIGTPTGWAAIESTWGNRNGQYADESKVSDPDTHSLQAIADAPVSGSRGFRILKARADYGGAYGARAVPVKPGEKIVVALDYFGATRSDGGLYFRASFCAVRPTSGFVYVDNRQVTIDLIGDGPIPLTLTHGEFVLTVPPGMFWMSLGVYNWVRGVTDLRFDNVAAYRVVDFSTAVGGLTKPENNATVGAIAGINLLDGVNGIVLALNAIKTSLGIASGFLNQGLLAVKSTVTTSLMTEASDNIVPDGSFTDVVWWKGGMPDMNPGANFSVGPAQNNEFWGLSTGWLIMAPGDFDASTPYFNVSLGGTYKIEVRVYTTDDFQGWVTPTLHIPYTAWYSLTRGPIPDPNDPNLSDLRSGGISIRKEWIFKNPPSSGENWWRRWQFRMRGVITRGNCHLQVRITRMTALNSLVTRDDGTTLLTDGAAVTSLGTAAGFAGQDWGATASQNSVANTSPIGTNTVVNSSFAATEPVTGRPSGWLASGGRTVGLNLAGYYGSRQVAYVYAGTSLTSEVDISTKSIWMGGETTRGAYTLQARPGERIGASVLVAGHRCTPRLFILGFNSDGVLIDAPNTTVGAVPGGAGNGENLGLMSLYYDVGPSVRFVQIMLRMDPSNEPDPFIFFAEPILCKMSSKQTVVPPYSPGPVDPRADRTAENVSDGFRGQSVWASYSGLLPTNVAGQVSRLQTDGFAPATMVYDPGGLGNLYDVYPAQRGANQTETRTAAGFTGQGALAKKNAVDYASEVTGSGRPETFIVGSLGNGSAGPDGYLHGLHTGDGRPVAVNSNGYHRSYTVVAYNINAKTWEVRAFDVYNNGEVQWNPGGPGANDANAMAAYLNGLPRGWPVVVYTSDEPSNNHLNAALIAAMCRCGATRTVFGSGFRVHSAYLLVGETYAGEGNGSEAYYDGGRDTSGVSCVSKTFSLINGRVAVSNKALGSAEDLKYLDGTSVQVLRPGEGGANVTEGRTAAGFAGQGALAKQNSVDYGSQIYSIPARLGPSPVHGGAYLDAAVVAFREGETTQSLRPQEGGANATEGRTAAGFAGQGALAKVSYIQQTNVASYFNFNAFSLNYSITRQDGTSIVTENLAITSLGVSSGFQGQGALAKMDQVGTSQIAPSSVQAIRFTRLSSTISLTRNQYSRIMEIGFTKAESGSLLKVSAFLQLYAVDDIRTSVFVNIYDGGGNLVASRTSTSNMIFDSSQSRARMPLSPICHFSGLGPGYYTVTVDANNTDPQRLDFEVDSSLEVMELKQAAM